MGQGGGSYRYSAVKSLRSDWQIDVVPAVIFLVAGLGLVLPEYVAFRTIPGDVADGRHIVTVLEFFSRTLTDLLHGTDADFLNAPFFYPWPRVTNFTDTFWGNGQPYALARALGADELASFQIWFITGIVLTYLAAFISFRKLGMGPWGAAAGAFLFTFALPMMAQTGHSQLFYRLWIPPAVVALDRLLTKGSLRAGAWCVVFVALQFATEVNLGLFLCMLLGAYTAAIFLVGRHRVTLPSTAQLRSVDLVEHGISAILFMVGLAVLAVVATCQRNYT
jgi:hypothetical protein